MARRLTRIAAVFIVIFAAAQLVRPERTNPPTDASRTLQARLGTTSDAAAVLDRSCRDCHSNSTEWPWYTNVAPLSWLAAQGVNAGRQAVNFSEWSAYSPAQQQTLLAASCDDASTGKMPGAYTFLRPETRLSPKDVETICAIVRRIGTTAEKGFPESEATP